jgi:hypothetical protein
MEYQLACACGKRIEVAATQAGTKVTCTCGNVVAVPRLSVLRRQNASAESSASPELVINQRYSYGRRPVGGNICLECKEPTDGRLWCIIECEKAWVRGDVPWYTWILNGILLSFGWAAVCQFRTQPEVIGEDRSYRVILALCSACQVELQDAQAFKEVLQGVPDFARLFERYPAAEVRAGAPVLSLNDIFKAEKDVG